MSEPIKPAMPEEEWKAQLARSPEERHDVLMHAKNEADAEGWLTIHGLAALALYNKPYGFTRVDVSWLRRMSFSTMDRTEAEAHQQWWQSFLARIEALLPPEAR